MFAIQKASFEIGPLFARVLIQEAHSGIQCVCNENLRDRTDFVAMMHSKQQIISVQWI